MAWLRRGGKQAGQNRQGKTGSTIPSPVDPQLSQGGRQQQLGQAGQRIVQCEALQLQGSAAAGPIGNVGGSLPEHSHESGAATERQDTLLLCQVNPAKQSRALHCTARACCMPASQRQSSQR